MNIPAQLKYTKTHEWVKVEADGTLTIGITDHAQEQLGDVVFVEPPAAGRSFQQGDACAVIESVKAAADIYAPVAGTVTASNSQIGDNPEQINLDAYAAWLFRLKPSNPNALADLLDAAAYQKMVQASEH